MLDVHGVTASTLLTYINSIYEVPGKKPIREITVSPLAAQPIQ